MCILRKRQKNGGQFENKYFDESKVDDMPKYDLVTIYEKCIDEMTLQQSKRDQIITIYLAMFSFIVPFALSSEQLDLFAKGFVFLSIAIIGFGFSLIIIRYRMYKEVYWICCQTITNLMSFKAGEIDKETIQAVYYTCLKKKGESFGINKNSKKIFRYWNFFWKNIFSGETIYCLIHTFIVSVLSGLSIFLISYEKPYNSINIGIIIGVISFILQVYYYFKNLIEVYNVLVDGTNDSFNKAFSKAWFLHLYVEKKEIGEEILPKS